MQFPSDQVAELKAAFPSAYGAEEGGITYFVIPNLILPSGSSPPSLDVLLCPTADRHGYPSRLFFAQQVQSSKPLNWNTNGVRILERNWYAYSGFPTKFLSRGDPSINDEDRFSRQSFLGRSAAQMIAACRIGIVGLGGGGSHIAQQLAHVGFGTFSLFDAE